MGRNWRFGVTGAVLAVLAGPACAAGAVVSDFEAGADGWVAQTFADNGRPTFGTLFVSTVFSPTAHATGGNPGGYISIADPNDGWTYFVAPGKFLGDQSDKLGGTLSFSLQQTTGNIFQPEPPHVALRSGSLVLVRDAGAVPAITPAWTSYSVSLSAGDWRVGTLVGAVATSGEIASVLGNLDGLFLVGEFVTPVVETNGLDSVTLAPVPLPMALWSLASALGVVGVRHRRRRSD